MNQFFKSFSISVIDCFKGRVLIWHFLVILLTIILVQSGFDWWFYQYTHTPGIRSLMFPAVKVGFFLPIFLPLILFFAGHSFNNSKVIQSGWALLQAELMGLLISSSYKAITGRAHPSHNDTGQDISHVFQFGLMRGGVFWGWPSSHTTIAFAMAFTLLTFFPKQRWMGMLAILYAFYVGLGVSMTIHWFSDFAAGAIIGAVIGMVAGKKWRQKAG